MGSPPTSEEIRIVRSELLTRRVRTCLQTFAKRRHYLGPDIPHIEWDEELVPPHLYENLGADLLAAKTQKDLIDTLNAIADTDSPVKTKDRKERDGAKESVKSEEIEPVIPKSDKGKGKAREGYEDVESAGKESTSKRVRKKHKSAAVVMSSDSEDGEGERPAKRVKITPVDTQPPPCERCILGRYECEPNGWRAACKRCQKARQSCTNSKLRREGDPAPKVPKVPRVPKAPKAPKEAKEPAEPEGQTQAGGSRGGSGAAPGSKKFQMEVLVPPKPAGTLSATIVVKRPRTVDPGPSRKVTPPAALESLSK